MGAGGAGDDTGTAPRGAVLPVALCTASLAAGTYATLSLAPLGPLVRADLGISRAQVGTLTAIVFAGAALASVPSGRLTDRFGAPPLLAGALASVAAAVLVVASAPWVPLFLVAVLGIGLAYGLITPPTNVIVRGAPTTRHRGLLMSIKQIGVTIGAVISGSTLPVLAEATSWRAALLAPAAVAGGLAALTVLVRRRLWAWAGPTTRGATTGVAAAAAPAAAPWSLPARWRLGIGVFGFLMGGLQISFAAYLAVFLTEAHGFGVATAGLSFAVAQGSATAGRLGWAVVSDRFYAGRRQVGLRLNAYGSLLALVGLALLPGGPWLWGCAVVFGLCNIGWNGVYMAMVAESAPRERIGRVSGDALRVIFAGCATLPPLLGLLADHAGWRTTWLVAACLAAVAAVGMLVAGREAPVPPDRVRGG